MDPSTIVRKLIVSRTRRPPVSTALFLESEEVLLRPENRLATGMSEADVEGFLAAFASAGQVITD